MPVALAEIDRQYAERARRRAGWIANAAAVGFVALALAGLIMIGWHFSRFHSGWREAVPEAIQDFGWLPVLGIAWGLRTWIYKFLIGA